MFKVDLRVLIEHAEGLHESYQKLMRDGSELSDVLKEIEALNASSYPTTRLREVQNSVTVAADRIRRIEKATENILENYSGTEQRVDSDIEDSQWRARNMLQTATEQNVSWVDGYMQQILI